MTSEFAIGSGPDGDVVIELLLESRGADVLPRDRTRGKWAVYVRKWPPGLSRALVSVRGLDEEEARAHFASLRQRYGA